MLDQILEKIKQNDKVIYLDECAAGVWAGDLFVCGAVYDEEGLERIAYANDSKKLTEEKRAILYPDMVKNAIDYQIVRITPKEVDEINILEARMKGFKDAINILSERTGVKYAVIDGNRKPKNGLLIETDVLTKGDALIKGISCASIICKYTHTEYMLDLSKEEPYSLYGLDKHKGYGTAKHLEALEKYGPIKDFHRFSFKPIKALI